MVDKREQQLASNLVNNSVKLQKGENILIDIAGKECYCLANQIIKEVYKVGGNPFLKLTDSNLQVSLLKQANKEMLEKMEQWELEQMKQMQAYIAIRASDNISNSKGISKEQMDLVEIEYQNKILEQRVNHTKWVILRYPNGAMAQLAGMNTEEFEDFYFKVCNLDYPNMEKAMQALKRKMAQTDKVRIKGEGTDLSFSIKGMGAICCAGEANIPDGEVYTAPICDSVNGTITYNTKSTYWNETFENICFTFENGKIIKATSNHTTRLNEILDVDLGARRIGEFALGVNPYINHPMNDTLFDEKIAGSFHFTPGNVCSEDMDNGNRSVIHWDLVCIQTKEYGGGEIYFDDVLIRKDGRFVLEELEGLNPENLM